MSKRQGSSALLDQYSREGREEESDGEDGDGEEDYVDDDEDLEGADSEVAHPVACRIFPEEEDFEAAYNALRRHAISRGARASEGAGHSYDGDGRGLPTLLRSQARLPAMSDSVLISVQVQVSLRFTWSYVTYTDSG